MSISRTAFLEKLHGLTSSDLIPLRREELVNELLIEPAFPGGRTLIQHVRVRLYGGEFGYWLESEIEWIGKRALVDLVLWTSMVGDVDQWQSISNYFNRRIQHHSRQVQAKLGGEEPAPDVPGAGSSDQEMIAVDRNLATLLYQAFGDVVPDDDLVLKR